MYPTSTPCATNLLRTAGFSWMNTLVPGGARDVFLKSNAPFSCDSSESIRLIMEEQSRFRANWTCGRTISHIWRRKF